MQFSIQGEAGQSHHRSVFAALQCTINFCSFTGCGLSDPVTVSNMIWFLRGYFFSRAISLFSFILLFVICSKYTEFQFLSLYKSMSRRLQWLLLPHHESGWSWVTIPSHLGRELGPGCDTGLHCDEGVPESGDSWSVVYKPKGVYIQRRPFNLYPFMMQKRKKGLKESSWKGKTGMEILSLLWYDVW